MKNVQNQIFLQAFLVRVPITVDNNIMYLTCAESYHRKHETNTVLGIYSTLVNHCEINVFINRLIKQYVKVNGQL